MLKRSLYFLSLLLIISLNPLMADAQTKSATRIRFADNPHGEKP